MTEGETSPHRAHTDGVTQSLWCWKQRWKLVRSPKARANLYFLLHSMILIRAKKRPVVFYVRSVISRDKLTEQLGAGHALIAERNITWGLYPIYQHFLYSSGWPWAVKQENKRQLSSKFCDCPILFTRKKKKNDTCKNLKLILKTSFQKF